jgi:hypothetical protein
MTDDEHAAFLNRWDSVRRGGVDVARCRVCGFETFAFADASIEEHDTKCMTQPHAPRRRR